MQQSINTYIDRNLKNYKEGLLFYGYVSNLKGLYRNGCALFRPMCLKELKLVNHTRFKSAQHSIAFKISKFPKIPKCRGLWSYLGNCQVTSSWREKNENLRFSMFIDVYRVYIRGLREFLSCFDKIFMIARPSRVLAADIKS